MDGPLDLASNRRDLYVEHDAAARALSHAPVLPRQRLSATSARYDVARSSEKPITPRLRLGAWNYYFVVKLMLFWNGSIGLHPLENLAFAAWLLVPVHSAAWRRARNWTAVPIGIALLYYDTWLPPIGRVLSQASLLSSFSLVYLAELVGRFISWPVVAALVIAWVLYRIIAIRVRVGVLVVAALVALSFIDHRSGMQSDSSAAQMSHDGGHNGTGVPGGKADMDEVLREFYAKESQRSVAFAKPADGDKPFDVILLHICSLAWDDLRMMGLEQHSLWKRFDMVFTRFNSAASYSGPAAIRVLRASCGQPSHRGLYSAVEQRCYLMGSLKEVGFEPNLLLNHDGHFDDFLGVVRTRGGLDISPMSLNGLPVAQRSFDQSPIYDDLAVLSRWLETRRDNNAPRVATFFNTVSLHDGNHLVGADSNRSSRETYKLRLTKLLNDLDQFLQKLEDSHRRVVVFVVPEHGAAMRGDKMQIPGLREIPSPAITLVPVGVKVIGPEARRSGATLYIDRPASYLAMSHIMARMLQQSPYSTAGFNPADYVSELPATEFVAENEDMVTMRRGEKYALRLGKEGWSEYPVSAH